MWGSNCERVIFLWNETKATSESGRYCFVCPPNPLNVACWNACVNARRVTNYTHTLAPLISSSYSFSLSFSLFDLLKNSIVIFVVSMLSCSLYCFYCRRFCLSIHMGFHSMTNLWHILEKKINFIFFLGVIWFECNTLHNKCRRRTSSLSIVHFVVRLSCTISILLIFFKSIPLLKN